MAAKKPAPGSAKASKPAAGVRAPATDAKAKPAGKSARTPVEPATGTQTTVSPPPSKKTKAAASAPPPAPISAVTTPDDGEASEHALLSGPRNVQPYVVKRGEQYMSKEQLEHFRQILGIWKRDLMVEVDRTVSHMKDEAANFPDPNDRATQEEEFSLELRTRDRERKLIRKIDEALKRIEDGSYGYCLETGEQIGLKRLEARPVATLCLEAQERRERREKQYGDRDDHYR